MSRMLAWLDDRTGCSAVARALLYENIPGGARWRYAWGHALALMFFVQVVTGLALWMAYSPGRNSAWESVYFIQHAMTLGWLLRGVHHFSSHVMIVLLAIHFLQIILYGAYRAPREVNYWLGLVMMLVVLKIALTGYWLPADQRAYASIQVTVNLVRSIPYVGDGLARLVLGGSDFGNQTLTRAFSMHGGVLPALLAVLFAIHYALVRRNGRRTPADADLSKTATYWPDQWLRNVALCVAAVGIAVGFAYFCRPNDAAIVGAGLGAPADVTENSGAARPEAYFLFLYQLLKYLESYPTVVGALAVPAGVLLVLILMPLWGRWKIGHAFNVICSILLIGGIAVLTAVAVRYDFNGETEASKQYLAAIDAAKNKARRVVELAGSPSGIPPEGALAMLRHDPKLQGPVLFRQHCASCHSHFDPAEKDALSERIVADPPTAANLWKFGSRQWVAGVLNPETVAGPHYFGKTAFAETEMVNWVKDNIGTKLEELKDEELAAFRRKVEDVTYAVSAEAQLAYENEGNTEETAARITAGRAAIVNDFVCTECHKFRDDGGLGEAPDLTGYASREWLAGIIADPAHLRFYRESNDRMPAFAPGGDDSAAPSRLRPEELDLLVSWLRRVWYEPAVK
ncbi:MAG: cytochrome b N-terminal domain-containing protein [Pirellulales bacterium]